MGIVLFYLLRLEPFTSLHRRLQVGRRAISLIGALSNVNLANLTPSL